MPLPAPLREAIEQELSQYAGAQLRMAAARLSERYRNAQPDGGPHLPAVGKCGVGCDAIKDDLDRAAYLAVRMPATFAATAAALGWTREAFIDALGTEHGEDASLIRSVLDLGSGLGTALWAAGQLFPNLSSATAVERDPRLIAMGRRMAAHSEAAAVREAQWLCGDLTSELPSGHWDLVILAYALNEIGEGHRARLIRQAWARTSKLLVIVEPGTRAGFGNVLAVRSQMLSPQPANHAPEFAPECGADTPVLIAPCPHSLTCPMAAIGDWCHFAARVERTSVHRRLKDAELGHEDEKFSYVAFMRAAPREEVRPPARIVRHPRIFSGYAQLTLCTEGRLEQTTVTRSQKEDWRRLKRLGWGDRW